MLHEHDQYLGGFGCERNAFTITREDSLTRIQLIWSEFVTQIIVAHRFRESRFQPKRCIFQPAPVTQVVVLPTSSFNFSEICVFSVSPNHHSLPQTSLTKGAPHLRDHHTPLNAA